MIHANVCDFSQVRVRVEDVNEPPKFTEEVYEAAVINIAPYKTPVTQVKVNGQLPSVSVCWDSSFIAGVTASALAVMMIRTAAYFDPKPPICCS